MVALQSLSIVFGLLSHATLLLEHGEDLQPVSSLIEKKWEQTDVSSVSELEGVLISVQNSDRSDLKLNPTLCVDRAKFLLIKQTGKGFSSKCPCEVHGASSQKHAFSEFKMRIQKEHKIVRTLLDLNDVELIDLVFLISYSTCGDIEISKSTKDDSRLSLLLSSKDSIPIRVITTPPVIIVGGNETALCYNKTKHQYFRTNLEFSSRQLRKESSLRSSSFIQTERSEVAAMAMEATLRRMAQIVADVVEMVTMSTQDDFVQYLAQAIFAGVPPKSVEIATIVLRMLLANRVADALGHHIPHRLVPTLTNLVTPSVIVAGARKVSLRVERHLDKLLRYHIPLEVLELPTMVVDNVVGPLVARLTHSVTLSLVNTLTVALSKEQSTQRWYYSAYYSTYYGDYFGRYYGMYYQEAADLVRAKQIYLAEVRSNSAKQFDPTPNDYLKAMPPKFADFECNRASHCEKNTQWLARRPPA